MGAVLSVFFQPAVSIGSDVRWYGMCYRNPDSPARHGLSDAHAALAMLEIVTNITLVGLSGAQSSIVFRLEKQTPLHVYGVIAGILLGVTLIAYGVFCVLLKRRVYQWQ